MSRRTRLKLAGIAVHAIQRGDNRSACFFAANDYQCYLDQLGQAWKRHAVELHAYVWMTNLVHLLTTPKEGDEEMGSEEMGQTRFFLAWPQFLPIFGFLFLTPFSQ